MNRNREILLHSNLVRLRNLKLSKYLRDNRDQSQYLQLKAHLEKSRISRLASAVLEILMDLNTP